MPTGDQAITQNRQAYSSEMLFSVPPMLLVEQIQKQLHETRMSINEQYRDVTESIEVISIVVEIIHDGEKR